MHDEDGPLSAHMLLDAWLLGPRVRTRALRDRDRDDEWNGERYGYRHSLYDGPETFHGSSLFSRIMRAVAAPNPHDARHA
jgi:hypothetical protein